MAFSLESLGEIKIEPPRIEAYFVDGDDEKADAIKRGRLIVSSKRAGR